MRIIAKSTLREFWEKHSDVEEALQAWYDDTERSHWKTPADIRAVYASASFLANNRVVFNIRGNHYDTVGLAYGGRDLTKRGKGSGGC
jgi:mRNA interferase HigB